MDLRREVAQVASQLGFTPKLALHNGHPPIDLNSIDDKPPEQKKKKKVQRSRQEKPTRQRTNVQRKQLKKRGVKTDVYDKHALLEILSGPEEKSAAKIKSKWSMQLRLSPDGSSQKSVRLDPFCRNPCLPFGTWPWRNCLRWRTQIPYRDWLSVPLRFNNNVRELPICVEMRKTPLSIGCIPARNKANGCYRYR